MVPLILGPNISGFFNSEDQWDNRDATTTHTGPFNYERCSGWEVNIASVRNTRNYKVLFDASLANEKYSAETVQPLSGYAFIIIKE